MSPHNDPVIIASHLPGEGHFRSERFRVLAACCQDDFDYWRWLSEAWDGSRTIVNVEHDIEVGDEHIHTLLACPFPLCSWLYECHWASGLPRGGWAQRGLYGDWADRSGLGLVKIAAAARVGVLRREPWPRVELAVEAAVAGPWHVHRPQVPHHHW